METTASPGCVQLSAAAAALLSARKPTGLVLTSRGEMAIKGKVSEAERCPRAFGITQCTSAMFRAA